MLTGNGPTDTDKIPQDKMDATGLILLGYLTPGDENEHLDVGE